MDEIEKRKQRLNELVVKHGFNAVAEAANLSASTLGIYLSTIDTQGNDYHTKTTSQDRLDLIEFRLKK